MDETLYFFAHRLIISLSLLLIIFIHRMILIISYTIYICFYSAEFRITFSVYTKLRALASNLGGGAGPNCTHRVIRPKGRGSDSDRSVVSKRSILLFTCLVYSLECRTSAQTPRYLRGRL